MDRLIRILEIECGRLEHLRYRASVVLLLLRAGENRFLGRAADELHDAVDQLTQVELARASVVSSLAAELAVPDEELTLEVLRDHAPPTLAARLAELRERLRAASAELEELRGAGSTVATGQLDRIQRSLARWGAGGAPRGRYELAPPSSPSRFDGAL